MQPDDIHTSSRAAQDKQSGSWSIDFLPSLNNIKQGNKSMANSDDNFQVLQDQHVNEPTQKMKKWRVSDFKHSTGFLKKVAHMPSNDKREILKILKKQERKRKVRKSPKTSKNGVSSTVESFKHSNWVRLLA